MEKVLLRCYAVALTLVVLWLVGYNNHAIQDRIVETSEQSAFLSFDPLPSRSTAPIEEGVFELVRVVDGDTLIVGDSTDRAKQYRVRLIGADTPEVVRPNTPIEPFGQEASDFTKTMIAEASNQVRIAFDGEQVDRYNRVLAMVYLTMPDGREVWLNELLIREGLAHARLEYRYSQGSKLAFALAEVEARKNKKNLWNDENLP